jgi:methylthioribulose 1-phosphate dehydratase / enolase-phosphatase E1
MNSALNGDAMASAIPGAGWSNGDIPPDALFASTQSGLKQRYASQRRWIGLYEGSGWTRLGEGGHEHDAKTSSSANLPSSSAEANVSPEEQVEQQAFGVRCLIAQLCETFYRAGWATGTGGGCSIRVTHPITREWRVFVAPSGIQKEDMIGDDIFELNMQRDVMVAPKTIGLRQSACTPLWYVVYQHRPTATCVIHTHSMAAVQATLLDTTEQSTFLRISHLEMLKGVGNHAYDDYLDIPIIENRPTEDLLADQLEQAVLAYPKCNAVLVRRHGLYCWGDTWEQAKTQCESFDYLFECVIRMKTLGMDAALPPASGTYRPDTVATTKKRKVDDALVSGDAATDGGFHGRAAVDNRSDWLACPVPLLPRDDHYKYLLLDIEGCTTSISFVKDVLFPYARDHMERYCHALLRSDPVYYSEVEVALATAVRNLIPTVGFLLEAPKTARWLMDRDVKVAPLKDLQGRIWKEGYETGALKGHVYADVPPAFAWMQQQGISVGIYSSGSIAAQKLLFGSTDQHGDLLRYISHHFDIPTAGPKKEATSYTAIAKSLGMPVDQIVFVSDCVEELAAARAAGLTAVLSVRPGNAPVSEEQRQSYPTVYSLLQLCGAD